MKCSSGNSTSPRTASCPSSSWRYRSCFPDEDEDDTQNENASNIVVLITAITIPAAVCCVFAIITAFCYKKRRGATVQTTETASESSINFSSVDSSSNREIAVYPQPLLSQPTMFPPPAYTPSPTRL